MKKKTIVERFEKAKTQGNVINVRANMLNSDEVVFCEDAEACVCLVLSKGDLKTLIGGNFSPSTALGMIKCFDAVKEELAQAAVKMITKGIKEEEN